MPLYYEFEEIILSFLNSWDIVIALLVSVGYFCFYLIWILWLFFRATLCHCSTGLIASWWSAVSQRWFWPTRAWCHPWECPCCVACVCSGCSRWLSTGSHCPTLSPRCSTQSSPSSPCCCCFSCSSWSLRCWACKCSAASLTLTPQSTNLAATSTPSRRAYSPCFRYAFNKREEWFFMALCFICRSWLVRIGTLWCTTVSGRMEAFHPLEL